MVTGFQRKKYIHQDLRRNPETGETFTEELGRYEDFYRGSTINFDPQIYDAFAILREDFERVEKGFQIQYVESIVHRDLHTQNVIFSQLNNILQVLIDFDGSKYGQLVHDLAFSIDAFSADRRDKFKAPEARLAHLFLEEYLRGFTLPDQDLAHLFEPLRADMVDRTPQFFRAHYDNEEARSAKIATHVSVHTRMRTLEKMLGLK